LSPDEVRALVGRYIDAYNNMDVAGMLRTVHPSLEFKNISNGTVNASASGIEELRALAEQSKSLYSERHQTILAFEITPDCAVVSIAFRAVIATDLPNGLKKGQEITLSGRSEFRFRDGVISQITDIS
jgi:hypothetical protein